jgi:gliding motility-associated lipoprotein GldH
MNIRTVFACLALVSFLGSCNHIYKEYDKQSFPNYIWKSGQKIVFTPRIEDVTKSYKLILGIRHLYGFQLNSLAVNLRSISPSGKETSNTFTLSIKDSENKYLGDCAGDICDLETVVINSIKFEETGTYKFIVTHNLSGKSLPGVMEFGLIINVND